MTLRGFACLNLLALLSLASVARVAAQETQHSSTHHRYQVIDVGTFGGPNADVLTPPPGTIILNNRGMFVGAGETTVPDPFAPNCFRDDCLVEQGLLYFRGVSTNLGSLDGVYTSLPVAINDFGVAVGFSQNGLIDPLLGTPELKAALWKNGPPIDLGTLGGNGASANAINNSGQIFGGALNTIPDPNPGFFFVPGATQVHAVLWEHGSIVDLGTLGGPDSVVYQANELGQAMGGSFTDNVTHDSTGLPTTHPFVWDRGRMYDVGTLGGSFAQGNGFNNRGEVAGFSLLQGDEILRPFLWSRGVLTDLGTLGGDTGDAYWVNEAGHVVGRADLPGSQSHHAFLWRNHTMKDLGAPHGNACSTGETINIFDQVVGDSGECGVGGDPFLWENGDVVALSDLVIPGSGLTVFDAFDINDRGEIVSFCATDAGNVHVCLLMPVHSEKLEAPQEDYASRTVLPQLKEYPKTGERRPVMNTGQQRQRSGGWRVKR
jgi:probable HAF family extracellular repeat protein